MSSAPFTLATSMGTDSLVIHGAREHNLKNVTLELPRDRLIVFTGLSGSGKSSLAFDTIYAEGQRRYVESLSAYARQFLGQMEKPDVDFIEGLSPAISIDQKSTSRNPRSTVGTITEIYDYLRVLYARVGHPHCYNCGRPIGRQTPDQIVDQVMELPEGTRFQVLAPIVRGRKGEYGKMLDELARKGFPRARIDGEVRELSEPIKLAEDLQAHDRGGRRPARRQARHPPACRRLDRDRAGARRGHRRDRRADPRRRARSSRTSPSRWRARTAASRSRSWRRGTSRSTRRTAPARPATGSAPASRWTRSWSCPTPISRSPRARIAPWASGTPRVLEPRARGGGRGARRSRSTRRGRSSRRRQRDVLLYGSRRGDPRPLQEPVQPPALVLDDLRGGASRTSSAATRDRLRRPAREARAVHARDPVPRVQGARAFARRPWPSRSAG